MQELTIPINEETIRGLRVGDPVSLSGVMMTGRDTVHKWMVETFIYNTRQPQDDDLDVYEAIKPLLNGGVIYHCGPVVRQDSDGSYAFVAAGPTTSIREEPYEADVIEQYGLRGVIGKGGMGAKTLAGLGEHGAVYLHAVGGAAQVLARAIPRVERVFMLEEFGVPEALWVIEVERFPVMVTMDSHGGSLHVEVEERSQAKLRELLGFAV